MVVIRSRKISSSNSLFARSRAASPSLAANAGSLSRWFSACESANGSFGGTVNASLSCLATSGTVVGNCVFTIDRPGKPDAIGDAKLRRQLLQIGEERALADNCGLRIDAAHCAHKHIKALVANESANRRDMTRVSLPDLLNTHARCRAKRTPIAEIYPVREDHAFGSVWSKDIRAVDHRLSRNDDFVRAGQHTAGEWTDDSPERGVTQHVCVPIDDERGARR